MIRPIDPGENPAVTGDQPTRIEGAERYERPAQVERVEGERVDRERAERRFERERLEEAMGAAGAGVLVFGGAASLVLSIIGLAGLYPAFLVAVASICLAGALFLKGSASASQQPVPEWQPGTSAFTFYDLGIGSAIELIGGAGGVVLGILALANIVPQTLMTVSAIVIGATLLLAITRTAAARGRMEEAVRAGVLSAMAIQVFVGAGAIVLGIVGASGFYPATLANVAFLAMGGAVLLAGLSAAGYLGAEVRRHRHWRKQEHEPTPATSS
jgi:hypothetical protein